MIRGIFGLAVRVMRVLIHHVRVGLGVVVVSLMGLLHGVTWHAVAHAVWIVWSMHAVHLVGPMVLAI